MNSFIEILNQRGSQFLRFAWPMLWQSSILITLLFALDFALRKKVRATVRYALWMLVLIKLILPASLSLPTSVGYWIPAPESVTMEEAMSPPILAEIQNPRQLAPSIATTSLHSAPAAPTAIPLPALLWPGIVVASWFSGITVLTFVFLLRARQAHRITARAATTDEFSELLTECARKMAVRSRISLRLSNAVETPAVCGLFHPVILLPKSLVAKLNQPQLHAVLLHELAHVRRWDLWVGLMQTALQIFYFYNPFLWLANAALRRAREEAVDELVLVAMADDAAVYPETLLNVAKFSLQTPRLAFGFAGILESKSTLGARIRLMLHRPWPTSAKLGLPAAAALLLLALILLPMGYARKMPSYQGKTAEQWLGEVDLSENQNEKPFSEAIYAFKQMGTKALPFLRIVLARTNTEGTGRFGYTAWINFTKQLFQTNSAATGVRRQRIIPGSGRGRPRITEVRENAAFVLEQMGPVAAPAIPELRAALSGGNMDVASRAAAALGAIGTPAHAAVSELFTALRSGNSFAGGALVKIDPENPALVPALIEVLQNPPPSFNSQPEVEAAVALENLGPKAKAAVPALRNMLAQTNGPMLPADRRVFAAFALQKVAWDQPELAAEINGVLRPPPGPLPDINQLLEVAEKAALTGRGPESIGYALQKLGNAVGEMRFRGAPVPEAMIQEKFLPLFERALDSSDSQEFSPAFGGLSGLGRAGAPLLPRVIAFLETNDSSARMNAIGALSSIAPGDMTTLPTLIHLLDDVAEAIKQNTCADLSHFGPEAKAAIPGLHRCLKENSFYIQFNATVALWRISKEPPSIPLLKTAISQDANGDYIPLRTLEMLGDLRAQTDEIKSILHQLAQSSSPEVQTNALALLDKIGEKRSIPKF